MGRSVLGSIPEPRNIYIGQLWPFLTALLGFLLWGLLIFIRVCMKQIKTCNSCKLKPKSCRLHREFNSGSKSIVSVSSGSQIMYLLYCCGCSIIFCATSVGSRPLALIWQNIEVREPWYSEFDISLLTICREDEISPLFCYSANLPETHQTRSFVKSNRFLLCLAERKTFHLMHFMLPKLYLLY